MSLKDFKFIGPGTFFYSQYPGTQSICIHHCSQLTGRTHELTKPVTIAMQKAAMEKLDYAAYIPFNIFVFKNSGQLTHWQSEFMRQSHSIKHAEGFYEYYF